MDNQNPSGKKLAQLRTFAKDQDKATNKTDSHGVGFVVSAQDSITEALSEINKVPTITETKITKAPVIEQKLAAPREHKTINQNKVIHELDALKNKESIQTDKITSLEQELDTKKPTPTSIPQLTKKTDADIKIHDSDEIISGATIITDTKKDRFKLFPAIGESLKNWFKELQKTREQKKKPKYTVPETTRRKGVIQKATSQTGKITTADHETLQERIRQRLEKEIVGFGNEEETNITWTPKTEPGFPLLEAGNEGVTNVQVVPRKNFYTKQQEIVVDDMKLVSETEVDKEIKRSEPEAEKITNNLTTDSKDSIVIPKPIVSEALVAESDFNKQETDTKTQVVLPAPILEEKEKRNNIKEFTEIPEAIEEYKEDSSVFEEEQEERQISNTRKNHGTSFSINTNLLSLILVIIIVTLLFVTGLGENLLKTNDQPEKVKIDHPKLINNELKLMVASDTKEGIESLIIGENGNSNKINQFVFIVNEGGRVLNPSSLMIKLGFGGSANFKQSVSYIFFGSIDKVPFVALNITDQNTARGGMLDWEESLHKDLKTIFNLSEENNNKFIDGMIGGTDVRVLRNSDNQEEILYGFTDSNTIIISKDSRTFTELLELTKQ